MAAVSMSIELEGDDELKLALYSLGGAIRERLMRQALRETMRPIEKEIRDRAPSDEGNLPASIDDVYRSYRGGNVAVAYVGPSWPRGAHGQIVERGTRQRYTREGHYRGMVEAYPFVEPAFDAQKITEDVGSHLGAAIEQEVGA